MFHYTKTKRYFTSFITLLLVLSMSFSGFPIVQLSDKLSDSKIVDSLYLSSKLDKVVDNFRVQTAKANPGTRVRTTEFFAGQYASATLANQNAIISFANQTFQLAETGADVIDAYVEVSAQIGAAVAATYAESFIYFDACVPACTPSLAAFTTTAGLGTNSGESQTIRFRANVTSEAEVAAYVGGAANRTFQVGYCFDTTAGGGCTGTTSANIQGANAKLVITYTYDDTSATQTNTVVYPIDSGTDIGSKIASQASCTMDTNCPTFSYNAEIPEITTQLSQFFYLQTSIDAATTTDWATISDIGTGANTATVYFEEALSTNGGWVNVMQSGVAGYANNTVQSLEFSTNGVSYVMGGENYVTYTYSNASATKTRTVVYPVGEVQTVGSVTKSALVGPTVFFPETGVVVKKAWFRVHTSAGGTGTAANLNITHKVGANAESSARAYAFATDTMGVSDDGYFNYIIPSAEYAELQTATGSSGKAVQMTAQWATAYGAVSAELVITYTYTGESGGYMVTQNLFAGQQVVAPATTFTTATGAINPAIPETTGTKTVRGASLLAIGKDGDLAVSGTIGSNLTTSTCSATATSTPLTDNEITRIRMWKDLTSVVTNNDATTYTACYAGSQTSVWGGIIIIIYQWDAPPPPTAALTGTVTESITEADIVTGGKTIILTLTNDTWVAAGATFDAQRQNIINGIDSAQAEGTGWDAEVKAREVVTAVVRTSATVVTVTLTAQAGYNITATETITATIPATALVGGNAIVATPTFNITPAAPPQTLTFSLGANSLNLGTLSSTAVVSSSHTLNVATNASGGMVVTVSGATLTSGANTITACATGCTSSIGSEQFGINLKDNVTPNVGLEASGTPPIGVAAAGYATVDNFRFVSGETIASSAGAINDTTFTVSYIVNIAAPTEAGSYTTTLTYVATATF